MKNYLFLVVLVLNVFVFSSCTEPVHPPPPSQLSFHSFEELKTVDTLIDGDPKVLEDYCKHTSSLMCEYAETVVALFSRLENVVIPYPKNSENVELTYACYSDLHDYSDIWYKKNKILFQARIWPYNEIRVYDEWNKDFKDRTAVYQWNIAGTEYPVYQSNHVRDFEFYRSHIFLENYQIIFTITKARDEEADEFYDVSYEDIHLNDLENFEFRTVREILDSMP